LHLRNYLNLFRVFYALLGELYAISQEWVRRPLRMCSFIRTSLMSRLALA
jgi:hypothetical protein